jgi:GAF domain-containing protein/HAMP domain-containing protein
MSHSRISSVQEISAQNRSLEAYRYAFITAFLMAGAAAAMLIQFGMPTNIFSTTLWAALVSLVALSSAWLIRQGRNDLGIGLIIGAVQVAIIFPSIETSGLGIAFAAVSISLTLSLSHFMRSRKLTTFATIASIVIAALLLSLDLFEPFERITNTDITFTWVVAGGMVLAYLMFIARRVWTSSLRNKLMVAFIGIMVVATGALAVYVFTSTSSILQQSLERELTEHADESALRIGALLNEQINMISAFALNEVLEQGAEDSNQAYSGGTAAIQAELDSKDAQWRAADAANNNSDPLVREYLSNQIALELLEFQKGSPSNVEVFTTDVYGGLVATTNRTSDYYQADEGWWQAAFNHGQGGVYISEPEYDESARALAILIAVPIRSDETGEIIGILRTTFLASALTPILGEPAGETGKTALIVPGEVIAYYQDGQMDSLAPEKYAALQAIADQSMVEMDYEGIPSVLVQAPIRTSQGNPAVDKLGWVVLFHQDRNEAFAPLNSQVRGAFIMIAIVLVLAIVAAVGLSLYLVRPILQLTRTAEGVASGDLNSIAEVTSSDEIGVLASTFNAMTSQLRDLIGSLEQRVAERTHSLELAAEVARSVSQVRALDVMLKEAAELIRSQFNLYYVQVYLTNQSQNALILQAGTGTVGTELVGRGHRLSINSGSINGRAAVEKRSIVISDTSASTTFRPNPLLPDTKSEMAIPLIVSEMVVGVLDLQSEKPGALSQDMLPAFEALAGQLAIAIQNANLLEKAESARAEVEKQAARLIRANWEEYLDATHKPENTGFVFERDKVIPLAEAEDIQSVRTNKTISAPIAIAGESLGSLIIEMDEQIQSTQTAELVNIVARQVAQQIENLRLVESAERYRSEAEQAARRITHEGWQEYIKSRSASSFSYLYDLNKVRLTNPSDEINESAVALPLKVREETIGKLAVNGLTPDDKDSIELVNAVAERLGAYIDSLRQHEQTQSALAQSEKLFDASSRLTQATDLQELVASVVNILDIIEVNRALLTSFDYDSAGEIKQLTVTGNWWSGEGTEITPVGTRYSLEVIQAMPMFVSSIPVFFNDTSTDERIDATTMKLVQRLNLRAVAVLPLHLGSRQIGALILEAEKPHTFTTDETRLFASLAPQIATVLENRQQYEKAQHQAEREAMLNVINQKIQSATTVDAVLQIAARELGNALGAPLTIAQLGLKNRSIGN